MTEEAVSGESQRADHYVQSLERGLSVITAFGPDSPQMTLSDGAAGGTRMDWHADVTISGSLASLGARLIEGTANKMIGQTFDCMKSTLEGTA